jgi:2',3'-cyclic-nucleotide 2'-phosphodiesterase (5'-nucleotidase family)
MVRRAGYLSSAAAAGPCLRLDNGDLTEARGRQDELKAETSIQLLNQLGYAAINLGEKEFRLGLPYLQYLASSFRGSLLCANARDTNDQPVFHEYVRQTLSARGQEIKVAVVGLLSQQFAPEVEGLNPGLKIAPAGDTLDRLRPSLEGQGLVLLLFHGEPEEARRLVAGQTWITAVIVAHAAEDQPRDLYQPGVPRLLTVGRDGKYLGIAELAAAATPGGRASLQKVRAVALGPEVPEDDAARGIETAYLQRVADEKLLDNVPRLPVPNGDRFAGTAACKSCHAAAYRIWAGSLHSHAWATLVSVRHNKDPDCVGCHTVGLNYQGGFTSPEKTPQFKNVGCENCHGPADRHAANPAQVRPAKIGADSCTSCHNPEQSPGFDFARFWAKIRH